MSSSFVELFQQDPLSFVREASQQVTLPANTTVFRQGDECAQYLFVLSGSVKVFSRAENGREVLLYRVRDNESCTLTTACLLGKNHYPAEGICETETTALAIPRNIFDQGLAQSELFRQMIFDQYAKRLTDVISVVEDLSFGRIDIRLARLLGKLAQENNDIEITHQSIATELGSAREVVSRQLKIFEQQGLIQLKRGHIEVINADGLKSLIENNLL